jgi:hypothetical protein
MSSSQGVTMPEHKTLQAARKDKRKGKSAGTQAGKFVREELHHVREGKHGARSAKQAIAIGLSKARRAGVALKAPGKGSSAETRRKAAKDSAKGRSAKHAVSRTRSKATSTALKREGRAAASKTALSRQAKSAAKRRGPTARSASARKAARTRKRRA